MKYAIKNRATAGIMSVMLLISFFVSCDKNKQPEIGSIENSLTLFKLDNVNNDENLQETDYVDSQSGIEGKYIPVYGNTGLAAGLGKIVLQLFDDAGQLLTSKEITKFFRPEYHIFNEQLNIPNEDRGKTYKIVVTSYDRSGNKTLEKSFLGVDVLTCDPLPACIVTNQITIMLETPENTPEDENIYIFGSINGWGNRADPIYMFHKSSEMSHCYCLSIAYPPGSVDWQLGEIYVSRGSWETQAVTLAGADLSWNYTTTERSPIWKIKVEKWRDL